MAKVEDFMTRKVLTISPDADLNDAAWGLTLKGVTGAPVRDDNGRIVGVLSKSDLVDPARHGDVREIKVADAMTPLLFAVRDTDSIRAAAQRMVQTGSHRLIVVDGNGALVGILTPMDLLRGLLDGRIRASDLEPEQ